MEAVLGLARLHHLASAGDRERVIRTAFEAGIHGFDAAPSYGDGLAERELGRVLSGAGGSRVTTKFGIPGARIGEWPMPVYLGVRAAGKVLGRAFGADFSRRRFTTAELVTSVEGSLRRMRRDVLDLLLAHEPRSIEHYRDLARLWPELERFVEAGDIRSFGVSGAIGTMLEAESEGLMHPDAVRMIELDDRVCELPRSWFERRRVRVFGVIKYVRRVHGPGRIDTKDVVGFLADRLPGCVPVIGTHNLDELGRLGRCLADTRPVEDA